MSERPWMPLYVNDFQLGTNDLSFDEIGVYLTMLMLMWRREDAALPNDMAWLKRSLQRCGTNLHGHTFKRIVPKLLERYFQLGDDGFWRNFRLSKERQKLGKLSANASQSANKRWAGLKEIKGLAHAMAMPRQCYSDSHSHSYKERGTSSLSSLNGSLARPEKEKEDGRGSEGTKGAEEIRNPIAQPNLTAPPTSKLVPRENRPTLDDLRAKYGDGWGIDGAKRKSAVERA